MSSSQAVPGRKALILLGFVLAAGATLSWAQEVEVKYRDGRFLETVGGVTIQRSDEASSDEAVLNMPFLPGDRVWTDQSGRAEVVFADGEILWIAERSKVDSLGRGGPDQDERLALRVFAGSFAARVRSGGPGFEFRAPGGTITTTGASAFRVDVRSGETILSVSEGAVLANLGGERLSVRAGDQVIYAAGKMEGPSEYRRADRDSFDRWTSVRSAELDRRASARDHERLPDELDPYGDELDANGEWVYDEPQGYVYVPRVSHDWAPYTYGRWVYTFYGWTWVADEPWGFATSHYGRWGHSSRLGWHWLPRAGFSGAWVSWSTPVGRWNHTIGWCALGFNDRPISSFTYGNGGRALPRGGARSTVPGQGWSFTNRTDMGRANIHRRRVEVPVEEAQRAAIWNKDTAPDRSFRETRRGANGRGRGAGLAEAAGAIGARGAVGRSDDRSSVPDTAPRIHLGHTPGDSTPELRSDPATTIPTPESRRRRGIGQDGFKEEQDNRKSRTRFDESGAAVQTPGNSDTAVAAPATPAPTSVNPGETNRDQPSRDPLLDRFFRSITRPDASNRDGATSSSRGDESSARRRETPRRDEGSSEDTGRGDRDRGRYRAPETSAAPERRAPERTSAPPRSNDQNRERPRPSGGERSQPRTQPAPSGGDSTDDQAARRRPRPDA